MLKAKFNLAGIFLSAALCAGALGAQAHSQTTEVTLAEKAIDKGDYLAAFNYLKPTADNGNATAQCLIAGLYDRGLGVKANSEEADKWYKAAAFNKKAEAVDQSITTWPHNQKELDLLLARVDKNDATAKNELGFLFQHGIAVEKDLAKAEQLYQEAAREGCGDALNNQAVLYFGEERSAHPMTEIVGLLQNAVDKGSAAAMTNLGWLYEKGEGVPRDYKLSVELTLRAAAHGIAAAEYNLGYFYQRGIGVERNLAFSEFFYAKASLNKQVRPDLYFGFMRSKMALPKISFNQTKRTTHPANVAAIGALAREEKAVH
jgi:TPR repeat protein